MDYGRVMFKNEKKLRPSDMRADRRPRPLVGRSLIALTFSHSRPLGGVFRSPLAAPTLRNLRTDKRFAWLGCLSELPHDSDL